MAVFFNTFPPQDLFGISEDSLMQVIFILVAIGFPITIILAYLFITPKEDTKENINKIFLENIPYKDIGLLSIDIDGNDYWIWKAISSIEPSIVIVEYNSILGSEKNYVVPYKEKFERNKAHYSNLYYGASLPALKKLGNEKGYALVACNSAGNNAFFVKSNLINEKVKEISVEDAFVERKFRESRDKNNKLNFLNSSQEKEIISKLPLEEV